MAVQNPSEESLRQKKLVFLVGAPRSGTTWLQLLLSRSPAVVTAQETDLFNVFLTPIIEAWNRHRRNGETVSLSEVLSDSDFESILRQTSSFVFARIAEKTPAATIVLEKTPQHVRYWQEILDLWPQAHFVHIIRDPRSVIASLRSAVKSWGPQWGPSDVPAICAQWISDVTHGRAIGAATQNYQEVKYQELVADTPGVLMRLLTGLGVTTELSECRRYAEECSIGNLKSARLNNAPFDLQRAGKYRFRTGTTDSWREELSRWEIAVIEHMAAPLMLQLGYTPESRGRILATVLRLQDRARSAGRAAKRRLRSPISVKPAAKWEVLR